MLFKPVLIDKILAGKKRQTRRPVKDEDILLDGRVGKQKQHIEEYIEGTPIYNQPYIDRVKWAVGNDYAVCPGHGKAGIWYACEPLMMWVGKPDHYPDAKPLRIRITRIRSEDVRNISAEDAVAEGFESTTEFLVTWMNFYDKPTLNTLNRASNVAWHGGLPHGIESVDMLWRHAALSPAALYSAWVLNFPRRGGAE